MILIDVLHVNYYIGFENKNMQEFILSVIRQRKKINKKIAYKINNIG